MSRSGKNHILMDGETVELVTRPHWRFIIAGVVVAVVTLLMWWRLSSLTSEVLGGAAPFLNLIFGLIAMIVFLRYTARPIIQWAVTKYTVTSYRVMSRSGIVTRRANDIPLDHVSNVNYSQSLFDRILSCGTLSLDSSGGEGVELEDVANVEHPSHSRASPLRAAPRTFH